MNSTMFNGFTVHDIERTGLRLRVRRGGSGPLLLLVHGRPQTHAMSRRALDCGH
jgi:haloacetate dehalogenase